MAHYITKLLRLTPIYSDMENLVLRAIRRSRVQRESEQNGSAFVWLTWSDGVLEYWDTARGGWFFRNNIFFVQSICVQRSLSLLHYSITP